MSDTGGSAASSPANGRPPKSRPGGRNQKPLTAQEKNQNHIGAEKRRRETIRSAFDNLTEIVPGTVGMARSENFMLEKLTEEVMKQLRERMRLIEELEKRGIPVAAEDKEPLKNLPRIRDPLTGDFMLPRPPGFGRELGRVVAVDGMKGQLATVEEME